MFKKYSITDPILFKPNPNNAERIQKTTILGVGHPFLSDDAAGIVAMRQLKSHLEGFEAEQIQFIETESAPENFLGPICNFAPQRILLFDAIHALDEPGTIFTHEFQLGDLLDSQPFSLPLNNICFFLKKELACEITVIGIQIKNIQYGTIITPTVLQGITRFTKLLADSLHNQYPA